jgi:hypothetical protein
MSKTSLNEKLLLDVKADDKKKFVKDQSPLLLSLFALGLIFRIAYSYFENEASSALMFNLLISFIILSVTFSASIPLYWKANKELIKFPDKKNKKAMWLVIISQGMLQGVLLPAVMTDYSMNPISRIIFKHVFFLIFLGLITGYMAWDGWKTERIKELVDK